MSNDIIPYIEMCRREGVSLQKGMNYRINGSKTIILMSVRKNAPYQDQILDEGTILIYEGHDCSRNESTDPKMIDQPEFTSTGRLSDNGKFHQAAQEFRKGLRPPEKVTVYEKIHAGIWSYTGVFALIDSWKEHDGNRYVFKFKLAVINEKQDQETFLELEERSRIIPTHVKLEVWKRDNGQCVTCGAKTELHFDHIIPFSKGGTSLSADNIQLLCARHNLEKSDRIE